jgi:hypothetical protein
MTRLLLTLVVSMAMLGGCVLTTHKLSELGETVADDEIIGVWQAQDSLFNNTNHIAIQKHKDGFYLERDLDRADENKALFKLIKVGNVTYMECDIAEWLALSGEELGEAKKKEWATQPVNFFPWRWERRGEWIAIWQPNRTVIDRLLKEGKLTGRASEGWLSSTAVTSSAEDLAACLKEHSDEIYAINAPQPGHRHVYRRVSAQVPATTSEPTTTP